MPGAERPSCCAGSAPKGDRACGVMTNLFGSITAEIECVSYRGHEYRLEVAERIVQTGTERVAIPLDERRENGWTDDDGTEYLGPEYEAHPVFDSVYEVTGAWLLDGSGEGAPVTLEMTDELAEIAREGIEAMLDRCNPDRLPSERNDWPRAHASRGFRRHGDQTHQESQEQRHTVDGGPAPRSGTRALEPVGQRHTQGEDRRAESEARQHRGRAGGRDHSARTRSVAVGSTYVDLLVSGSIVTI